MRIALAFLVAVTLAAPARGSQYNLEQVKQIIPSSDAKHLKLAGIRTTLDILIHGRTADDRKQLAAESGLSVEKIAAFVALADLMRVRGIGPDVARLLTAIGVKTLADLQRTDPAQAALQIQEVNHRLHLSTNPPGAQSIDYWIGQARSLPVVLE